MFNRMTLVASAVAVAALVAGAASPAMAGHDRMHKRGHGHHAHDRDVRGHHHKHHAEHHRGHKHCKHAHVKHALHHMGVVSWDEIEWEHGMWEVDDARRADGSQYDLKLHPRTLKVVHSKRER